VAKKGFRLILGCSLVIAIAALGPVARGNTGDHGVASSIANHLNDEAPEQRYTACVLLAELTAVPAATRSLRDAVEASDSQLEAACASYALARLTQEAEAVDRFIRIYLRGERAEQLWRLHERAGYPVSVAPPPERYLAELASRHDTALTALLSTLPHADGAHAESLTDLLTGLYRRYPDRVERVAHELDVDIDLVRESAVMPENDNG